MPGTGTVFTVSNSDHNFMPLCWPQRFAVHLLCLLACILLKSCWRQQMQLLSLQRTNFEDAACQGLQRAWP
jgi:hypothetical protein